MAEKLINDIGFYKRIKLCVLVVTAGCFCGCGGRGSIGPRSDSVQTVLSETDVSWRDLHQSDENMSAGSPPGREVSLSSGVGATPWRKRYGPAYPDRFWSSLGRDGKEFAPVLAEDAKAVFRDPASVLLLALAGTSGIVLHGANADTPIERHYEEHGSQLNSFWDTVGDAGGNPGTHFAVAGAMYFSGLAGKDYQTYENAKTLLSALALNGIVTSALKVAARTEAPNGNENVWPSGHTSSSFTMATVMWHQYGPQVGLPMMAFAGYVGYERIDARNHDFSDVISGALIGIAIGSVIADNHQTEIAEFTVSPYVNPASGAIGLAFGKEW